MANNTTKRSGGSGLGLAATLAATAAGLYYLYGKNGAKHRSQVKGWMLRAKGEVLDKMGKLDEITEGAYNRIVDDVTKQYNKYKEVDKTELANIALELKRAWGGIRTVAKDVSRAGTSKTKSSGKSTGATARKRSPRTKSKTSA